MSNLSELEEWKQAASVEAGLRREFYDKATAYRTEIERLTHGVREISRFLDENRPGDASFVCAALLADENSVRKEPG